MVDKRGRFFPMWVRYLMFGFVVSWIVSLGHWALVEIGALRRPPLNGHGFASEFDDLGQLALETAEDWSARPRSAERCRAYEAFAYGWPVPNWGSGFRDMIVAFKGRVVEPVLGVDIVGLWPRSPGGGDFQRLAPVLPLVHQSFVTAPFWAVVSWLVVAGPGWWRRRALGEVPCERCGYDLTGTPGRRPCPECGAVALRPRSQGAAETSGKTGG